MSKYGQYCPIAKSLEILGDSWTLLIVRDMLTGTRHFNSLERGLPGISRALLASRLRQLQKGGIVEKRLTDSGRQTTEYQLTQAGQELLNVMLPLKTWGEKWAFSDPAPEDLDPSLLMWWLHNRVNRELLPEYRVVVEFDFPGAKIINFWLVMTKEDVSLCLTDPGYEINLLITADLAVFFKIWGERLSYQDALKYNGVSIEGIPSLTRAFPSWFGWSVAAPVRSPAPFLIN